jgi:hypothetical protein
MGAIDEIEKLSQRSNQTNTIQRIYSVKIDRD